MLSTPMTCRARLSSLSHLIAEGHRDIWFIGDVELPWYARCAQGYRKACRKPALSRA